MKRYASILALLLSTAIMLTSCNISGIIPSTKPNGDIPEGTPPNQTTPDINRPTTSASAPKKILAIGNSFSVDAMEHLAEILVGEGYTDFILGNLFIPGCTLDGHRSRIDSCAADYVFYTNTGTGWQSTPSNILSGLTYTDWDVITVQQASGSSGVADTFGNLDYIIDYVRSAVKNPDLKIYWHMTWAYQGNSNHSEFYKYNNNQNVMYNAIISAVNEKIINNDGIDGILPCGTAIQNLRTSYLGDTLTRDGYHLSEDIGRYTASLVWYKKLMGADLTDLTTTPTAFFDIARHLPAIKEAVNNAIITPYSVTNATVSEPTTADPTDAFWDMTEQDRTYLIGRGLNPDDYDILDLGLVYRGYYFSTSMPAATIERGASNSSLFIATKLFTPQTLPTGSIIRVNDGYKYRLEGWQKAGTTNALARRDNSTTDMVVDAELYTQYNFVALNISRTDGKSVTLEDGLGVRIYVPKDTASDLSMTDNDKSYLGGLGLDYNDYEKIELDYTLFAYYYSISSYSSNIMSAESCTENNLVNFIATKLFSKDEIPTGSVIRIDEGYQFRPDSFVTLGTPTSTRRGNCTQSVIVDDSWWGGYNYVGFNITRQGAPQDYIASMETGTHFVIYVPKTK